MTSTRPQELQHLLAGAGVQRAGRFVGDHRVWPHDKRAGDGDALLLTAGQLTRPVVEPVGETDPVGELAQPIPVDSVLGQPRRQSDVLGDRKRELMRLYAWKTNPIFTLRSSVSCRSVIPVSSVPPSHTDPDVGRSSPAAQCSRVLLPEPDGPITAVKLPLSRPSDTPRRACTARRPEP
jgi:hypothetical protein